MDNKKFKIGELAYDTRNKRYGTIIDIYNEEQYDVRLDSDGMQPIEFLRKLGEIGDNGTKEQLLEAIKSIESLRLKYPDKNYPEIINNPLINKIEFSLQFGGFYDSVHSGILDNEVYCILEENGNAVSENDEFNQDNIDWRATHDNYAKNYLDNLNELLELNLEYKGLHSPKYYNFSTDSIDCAIDNITYNDLKHAYCNDNDFVKWLNDASSSRDGFHSFCSGIEEVKKEPSILMEYIFQYIIWHNGSSEYNSVELENEILEEITCNGGAEIHFSAVDKKKIEYNNN